jgi:hypothetical protein
VATSPASSSAPRLCFDEVREHAQLEVRQRAHGERNAVLRKPLHQRRVFRALHAVVDALDLQHIERAPHVLGRPLLTRMRDQVQAQLAAAREHARELLGRMADFARIESHADELVAERQRLLQRLERLFFAQMAQEAEDERGAHAELRLCIDARAVQAVDHRLHRHAARGVRLRVEEHLGVHHVVGRGALQVSPGHVVEVLLFQQHARAGVVDVQEALQVGEGVGAAQFFDAGIRNGHAVALREREDQLGFERAFDVHVQLGLGHGAQQFGEAVGGDAVEALVVGGAEIGHGGETLRCDPAQHKRRRRAVYRDVYIHAMRAPLQEPLETSSADRFPRHPGLSGGG